MFVQAEAILALEAAASSLARPGLVALNIVTSPYGGYFGGWLRRGGATVHEVEAEAGRPVAVAAVQAALEALPRVDSWRWCMRKRRAAFSIRCRRSRRWRRRAARCWWSMRSPRSAGTRSMSMRSASISASPVRKRRWAGRPGCRSSVSAAPGRRWQSRPGRLALEPVAARSQGQLAGPRPWRVPGMPSALEFWALEAALDRVEAETLPQLIIRHRLAAEATRGGLIALGVGLWAPQTAEASNLVTTTSVAPVPRSGGSHRILAPVWGAWCPRNSARPAIGCCGWNHTGTNADPASVIANVVAYGNGTPPAQCELRRRQSCRDSSPNPRNCWGIEAFVSHARSTFALNSGLTRDRLIGNGPHPLMSNQWAGPRSAVTFDIALNNG